MPIVKLDMVQSMLMSAEDNTLLHDTTTTPLTVRALRQALAVVRGVS